MKHICPSCNGDGYTAEHDSPGTHDEDGGCLSCPIQVPCEFCQGVGNIENGG